MGYYSHSQVGTFLTCPRKYKYDKIDGLGKTTTESSLNLILGTAVHSALEFVYKQRTNLRTPHIDQMMTWYTGVFSKECAASSTHFLDDEIELFKERGRTYLHRYWETYAPFDQAITMSVEQSFSIKLDDQISFSGYIDRIDIQGDRLILIDYKTNKQLLPDDADTHRQQLTLYALGMQQKYGSKFSQIDACLIYLHLEKELLRTVSDEDLAQVKTRYLDNAQAIETAKNRLMREPDNDDVFPALIGKHCDYCPFQMICPQRKHHYMDDELLSTELGEKTIKSMIDEYAVLSKKLNELDKEKKTIAQILVSYATEKQLDKLYGNERKTSLQSRTYRSVRPETEQELWTRATQEQLAEKLLTTNTHALAALIKEQQIPVEKQTSWLISKESSRLGPVSKTT